MRGYGRCVLSPPQTETPATGRGTFLLSSGDVKENPGPPPPGWGEEDYAVLSDLLLEACARLGIVPLSNDFATPTNRCFPAFWTKAEDAFAQAWD